ncbi:MULTISPECIES: nucleopolyhedrovirus P10 family protein [Streptomyces]|uniref:Nucleopolyhedrovirus P10 family protein n=1 Tax=Streptomyces venezuelae TaxID=54571 RepID=A0A5P2B9G1_STRVZ|nr:MULTISPECIES: nucleopolyhedrovirus P10 family protein [Streptomyces]MYZ18367.1 nucleopolyhedrovirus P10 family protein [Streptomyces sp. SID337]NEB47955.1 nucleopolyhedrovirus P10 family protein [Streptomyces sp. SID339]QES26428.1 nucleopolyhedrovirus P10 family protein [Streptomyces venezuelae]
MTGEGWTQAVRRQLGLGRVLPLGGAADGVWMTESAADGALRQMAERVPGVRLGAVRIALAAPDRAGTPAVPPPPSALGPGPLRITGEFAAVAGEPLPAAADRLRAALYEAAAGLGLVTTEVDLKATALLDEADGTDEAPARPADGPPHPSPEPPPAEGADTDEARAERAALSVPGVTRLTGVLGRAVHFEEPPATGTLPRRHARVELATDREHRALDVALAVREAVGAALPDGPSVAVLVTEVR